MDVDLGKLKAASLPIVAVGTILSIILTALSLLPLLLTGTYAQLLAILIMAFSFLTVPAFLVLYAFAGLRAATSFSMDWAGCALVSGGSYLVVALIHMVLDMLSRLATGAWFMGMLGSQGQPAEAALFGGIFGMAGVTFSLTYSVFAIPVGTVINLAIGAVIGFLAGERKSGSRSPKGN